MTKLKVSSWNDGKQNPKFNLTVLDNNKFHLERIKKENNNL